MVLKLFEGLFFFKMFAKLLINGFMAKFILKKFL